MKYSAILQVLLILILSTNFSYNALAQNNAAFDSLVAVLNKMKTDDTAKVDLLCQISDACTNEKMLDYLIPAYELAKKLNYRKGISCVLTNISYVESTKGNYSHALEGFKKSLSIMMSYGDKREIASIYNNIGFIYQRFGDIKLATEYFTKSLKLNEAIDDKKQMAFSFTNLASIHRSQHDELKAFEYYKKALVLNRALNDSAGICYSLNNIGSWFLNQKNYEKAFWYYNSSLNIAQNYGLQSDIANSLEGLSAVFQTSKDYEKALSYNFKALKINEEIGNKEAITYSYFKIARLYFNQKNVAEAMKNAKHSLMLSHELKTPSYIRDAALILSLIYNERQSYKDAYQMHVLYKQMADSVINDETKKTSLKIQLQYDFDKKQEELKAYQNKKDVLAKAEISRQKVIRNAITGGAGVVIISSFFSFIFYKRKQDLSFKNDVSEVEMKALRAQMNPHFIFNSLNSINQYMMNNDKKKASDFMTKFAKLMRLILDNSRSQEVLLEDDLSALELYMQLESLRFQNKFQYFIEIDPQIDIENTLIPPMLLQPFVENSILHGFRSKVNGIVKISIIKAGDMILCSVEDNGVGREQSTLIETGEKKKRESLAVKITQERLHIINRLKKVKTAMNIFDLKDNLNNVQGLRVELLLPFEQNF